MDAKEILEALDFEVSCQNPSCKATPAVAESFMRIAPCREECSRHTNHMFVCAACLRRYQTDGGRCTVCSRHIPSKSFSLFRSLRQGSKP